MNNAAARSYGPHIALVGLLAGLFALGFWVFSAGDAHSGKGQGGDPGAGMGGRDGADPNRDRSSATKIAADEISAERGDNKREEVVVPFYGLVVDSVSLEPVPFLDLIVVHWPEWTSEVPGDDAEQQRLLTRRSSVGLEQHGPRLEIEARTDEKGEFEIAIRGRQGNLALIASDGERGRAVAFTNGSCLELQRLPDGWARREHPLEFTANIGPTIALNLTPPGQLMIADVVEANHLAASGEGPDYHAYLDMAGDTRQGVEWFKVRYDVHPALEMVQVDAFTERGFPERISHPPAWIRLPAVPETDHAPGSRDIIVHAQSRDGLLAGSGAIPIVQGIQETAVPLAMTERGVIFGRVLGQDAIRDPAGEHRGMPEWRVQMRSLELNRLPFERGMGERLVTSMSGEFRIENIPKGAWQLQVWPKQGAPRLYEVNPKLGEQLEMDLAPPQSSAEYNQIKVELVDSLGTAGGKDWKKARIRRTFLKDKDAYKQISVVFRPQDAALAEVMPTIPASLAALDGSPGRQVYAVSQQGLPEGSYDILFGTDLAHEGSYGFVWEHEVVSWSVGGDPLELRVSCADRSGGRPWISPDPMSTVTVQRHFPIWSDRNGPISFFGWENALDAEPELIELEGDKVTPERLAGQRLVGLGENLAPLLEPKQRPDFKDPVTLEPMTAQLGWGIGVVVSLYTPESTEPLDPESPSYGFFYDSLAMPKPLIGAQILVDGAPVTRTDGHGRAVVAMNIPPARVSVDYPGYHMLDRPKDSTSLPLDKPPLGHSIYHVLMVRD
jgi:hypothetical protein